MMTNLTRGQTKPALRRFKAFDRSEIRLLDLVWRHDHFAEDVEILVAVEVGFVGPDAVDVELIVAVVAMHGDDAGDDAVELEEVVSAAHVDGEFVERGGNGDLIEAVVHGDDHVCREPQVVEEVVACIGINHDVITGVRVRNVHKISAVAGADIEFAVDVGGIDIQDRRAGVVANIKRPRDQAAEIHDIVARSANDVQIGVVLDIYTATARALHGEHIVAGAEVDVARTSVAGDVQIGLKHDIAFRAGINIKTGANVERTRGSSAEVVRCAVRAGDETIGTGAELNGDFVSDVKIGDAKKIVACTHIDGESGHIVKQLETVGCLIDGSRHERVVGVSANLHHAGCKRLDGNQIVGTIAVDIEHSARHERRNISGQGEPRLEFFNVQRQAMVANTHRKTPVGEGSRRDEQNTAAPRRVSNEMAIGRSRAFNSTLVRGRREFK